MVQEARPHRPMALTVGELQVVLPDAERTRLTPRIWRLLEGAVLAQTHGHHAEAEATIGEVERKLGVHAAHRAALKSSPEEVRRQISADKRRRLLERSQQAARAKLADPELPMPMTAEEALRKAEEHRQKALYLQTSDAKGNRRAIADHQDEARRLEIQALADDTAYRDAHWLWQAQQETVAQAALRGDSYESETVTLSTPMRDEHGAILRHKTGPDRGKEIRQVDSFTRTRNAKLGGLERAHAKGHLDHLGDEKRVKQLRRIGERYGAACEDLNPLRAADLENGGGGGGGSKGPQIKTIEAGETLAIMRRLMNPRQRAVMDWVCGHDLTIREAAREVGLHFDTTRSALCEGLQAADKAWREACKHHEPGEAVDRALEVDRMVRRVRL